MQTTEVLTSKQKFKKFLGEYNILLVTLLMVVVSTCLKGFTFLSLNNIINIIRSNSVIGIIAFGMAFVIITGNIDLSVGAEMVAVAALSITVINLTNSAILGVLTAFVAGIAFSVITGVIITKGRVPSFIVTLGFQYIYRSVLTYALNGGGVTTKNDAYLAISSTEIFGVIPLQIVYFFVMALIYWYISKYTTLGRRIYAVGSNERAARLSGIKTDRIKIMAFVLLGIAIAVGAIAESSRMGSINSTSSGTSYELNAIAMVVIGGVAMEGGKGKLSNTVFGAFIFGMISNILTLVGINTKLVNAVKGAIIIIAVLLQRGNKNNN
ncbi:MAG TPA: ABC transporter permease [Candidatus Pullichristensenella stercoripullorum]|nr:ABC transporter permease [Candidatus Pullichristensenella stercoripullorum]